MPASPQDILQAFDRLPQSEQHLVAVEMIRRLSPWGVDSSDGSELTRLTAERFRSLGTEEGASPLRLSDADAAPPAG